MTDGGEAECVLLYNPDTNKFELRPVDYSIRVAPASKDRKTPEEDDEPAAVEAPVYTKPEDTMQHWEEKFRDQDNKGSKYKSYDRGSADRRPYKSKPAATRQVAAPVQKIEMNIPDNADADVEMGQDGSEIEDDDDDDDELLGELVNELEGSLEDDTKPITPVNNKEESDSESDGGMQGGMIEIVETRSKPSSSTKSSSFYQSPPKASSQGPISLRGFISGQQRRTNEEDLLSSSEEE